MGGGRSDRCREASSLGHTRGGGGLWPRRSRTPHGSPIPRAGTAHWTAEDRAHPEGDQSQREPSLETQIRSWNTEKPGGKKRCTPRSPRERAPGTAGGAATWPCRGAGTSPGPAEGTPPRTESAAAPGVAPRTEARTGLGLAAGSRPGLAPGTEEDTPPGPAPGTSPGRGPGTAGGTPPQPLPGTALGSFEDRAGAHMAACSAARARTSWGRFAEPETNTRLETVCVNSARRGLRDGAWGALPP